MLALLLSNTPPDSEAVFREHFRFVCATLRRLGVRTADVEDVAQEVFVIVHRRLPASDSTLPMRPWLFGICLNAARSHNRLARHRRELPALDTDTSPDRRPLPDEQLALRQEHALVLRALDTLDLDRRAVLIMHDLDGFNGAQIASALSIPLNTVYSRLRIGREELERAHHRLRQAPPRVIR